MEIVIAIVQMVLLVAVAPLISGTARWITAKMQTRQGPPVLQDYYDIVKLLKRQDVSSKDTSFVHRFMPLLYVGCMLVILLGLPIITRESPIPPLADAILIVYLLALPRFFFSLASIDTSGAYAGTGGIRELLIGVLVEPALMLSLFVAALACGSTNIGIIGSEVGSFTSSCPVAMVVAAVAFAVACYIEMGKLPYDLAEAEQEIQEGPLQEYSGPSLATMKVGMTLKQIVVASLFIAVFIPFGSAVDMQPLSLLLGLVFYVIKLAVVFLICSFVENLVSRVRFKLVGHQTWLVVGISALSLVFCV
ncbi:MAG: NADH-quinone oxidoreductase subunit H, partial [Coriobacteriales bacterium]|nr:NADH-quinone oxidoreductase subunit H [Coriobacteriales bacterium]